MVVDDLRQLPESPITVAEGSTLAASVVSPGTVDPARAIWLIPTEEFQRELLEARGLAGETTAFYGFLRERIADEAERHRAPTLLVDGSLDVGGVLRLVETRFAEALAQGPRAATVGERAALLREANESIAAQVRGYFSRPWARGDAGQVEREFFCECGDVTCDATVRTSVAAAEASPVLAHAIPPAA
jgi:hypothetical protein